MRVYRAACLSAYVIADASKKILSTFGEAGAVPVIPYKSNRRNIPKHFAKALYRGRARIEQMMGRLKRFKRVALRCEKTAGNFRAIVAIAAAFILIKSVHTA